MEGKPARTDENEGTTDDDGLRLRLVALGAAGVAFSAALAAIALSNPTAADATTVAIIAIMLTAIPIGVGIYAWAREPKNRFGSLLVATGFLWGLTALSGSADDVVYSIGRVTLWFAEVALLYTMLAFPTGRLRGQAERALVVALGVLVATLYLPTAFVAEQFVLPFPLTTCTADCPTNAFMLSGSEPAFLGEIEQLRDFLAAFLFAAAVSILALRIRRATPLMRPMLIPLLAVAILRLVSVGAYQFGASYYPDSSFTDAVGWLSGFGIPAMSLAFLVGLIYWRLVEARLLEQVTAVRVSDLGPEGLESLLAGAGLRGSVRVLYSVADPKGGPSRWTDGLGRIGWLPRPGSPQVLTEYESGGNQVAVIHEEMLYGQTRFVEAIAACAIASYEYERLSLALDSSLQEVAASRSRISAAADDERRRIERDLHDGAQQQLVTLRIKLELIAEGIESDPHGAAEQLRGAGTRLTDVLDEIRSLSRGIYPALLIDAGLGEALVAAGRRTSMPTKVDCDGVGRYPPETESAIYFCCLEALQNADKHAKGAKSTVVSVRESGGELRFEVRDDGEGFTPEATVNGGGLTNMHDRVAALGGTLKVTSAPGSGTRVRGKVPLAA